MLAFAGVVVMATLPLGLWQGFTPGPALFPVMIAGLPAILGVQLVVRALRGSGEGLIDWPGRRVQGTIALVYATLIGFFVLTPLIGMMPSIALFLAVVMIGVLRQPLVGSVLAVVITTGFLYLIFVLWLALPLPQGVWGR
jgi:hypothetical protein